MARVERRSLSGGTPEVDSAKPPTVISRGRPGPDIVPTSGAQATLDELEVLMMQGLTMGRQAVAVGETVKGVAVLLRDQLQETVRILGRVGR